jgi:DNA repair protein RadC
MQHKKLAVASADEKNRVEESRPVNIKNWSPADRPREKLLLKGTAALSDAELVAILLGTGTGALSAVDVAKKLLQGVDHSLHDLAMLGARDLMKVKGIGEAKAITIVAALELGRRRREVQTDEKIKIASSRDAYEIMRPHLLDLHHEVFWVILVNRANRVIRVQQISQGGVAGTVADPKLIFKSAVDNLASGIIVAHNHPSGNLSASQADIDLTKKLKEGSRLLEMQLLDHLIIAGQKYLSFADEGLL